MPDQVLWRPSHAYIPGLNKRHSEDLFDWIKDDTKDVACAYGLAFFEDRFYWEAHEVLEVVWLTCPQNSAEKLLVQSVIQFANAGLKFRMGKPKAGLKLVGIANALHADFLSRNDTGGLPVSIHKIQAQIEAEMGAL